MNTFIVLIVGIGLGIVIGLTFFGCRAGAWDDAPRTSRERNLQRDMWNLRQEFEYYQQQQQLEFPRTLEPCP